MPLKIALLTSCTVSRNFEPLVKIEDTPVFTTMNELCGWWVDAIRLEASHKDILKSPGELYAGVSFTPITEIAQDIGHENIYIVTGGVGLTKHTDKIVPYDFTSDKKADFNAHQHVTGEKFIPHIWWGKINSQLHKNAAPISHLLKKYDLIVGALPKAFIKYITQDLQAIDPEDLKSRVYIPIPRSMIGSVPKIVRSAFIPYSNDYTTGISYSRYDKPQRVAQKFIRHCTTLKSATTHAQEVIEAGTKLALSTSNNNADINYDDLFKQYPQLLEVESADVAIYNAKLLGIRLGGKHRFAGAWRGAKGLIKVKAPPDTIHDGREAFATLLAMARPKSFTNEDELLQQIGLFVSIVKESQPTFIFTAKDVATWGKLTYKEDANIAQSNKIAHLLNYHTKHLGLEVLISGSTRGYRLLDVDE